MAKQRVFLSSVYKSLSRVREDVHDLLVYLGYDVWWAEDHPDLRALSNEAGNAFCLQGIEACDIYLGIFPARYGSDPLGLSFTELEYHHAVSLGLPRFLYLLRDRCFVTDDQKNKQRGFLHLLQDRDLSAINPTRVKSIPELKTRISIDFENYSSSPIMPDAKPWQSPCIKQLVLSTSTISVPPTVPDLSIPDATALLEESANQSFQEAAILGLAFIQRFFINPKWADRRFLKDMDEFLRSWTYVSAWAGIGGPLGQTNISKSRIVLNQMLNDNTRVYDLAVDVASGLYSDRCIPAARRWCELQRFQPPTWLLGPIELFEGNVKGAKSRFLEMLSRPATKVDGHANHLAYYGLCLVKEGMRREGLRHLEESLNLVGLRATTLTRVHRSVAEAYLYIGDIELALAGSECSALIAHDNGLKGQLRKALVQRRKIVSALSSESM